MYAHWEAFLIVQEYDVRDNDAIERAVKHSDTVYNLIGRDWETKYNISLSFTDERSFKFNDVHVTAAQRIAEAAAKYNVSRLIHVSTYNADPNSESQFYASKVEDQQDLSNIRALVNSLSGKYSLQLQSSDHLPCLVLKIVF